MGYRIETYGEGSRIHEQELWLRGKVLREPLGRGSAAEIFPFEHDAIRFAALNQDQVVGVVLLHPRGVEAKLFQMAVLPEFQGLGIGRSLVAAAEDQARALGIPRMMLHSRFHVRGFYAGLGYLEEGEVFTEVGIPHILMYKKLG